MEFDAPASNVGAWMPALLLAMVFQFVALLPIVAGGPACSVVTYCAAMGAVLLLLVRVWRVLRRPMRYRIDSGVLVVPGHLGAVRVSLAGARVSAGAMSGWRVAGTALPPLLLGLYADREGTFHVATTAVDGVWVRGDRRIFVSPADVPGFVGALVAAGAVVER